MLVEKHDILSIQEQCDLLDLSRRIYYYEQKQETAENLQIMRLLDEIYLTPTRDKKCCMRGRFYRQEHQTYP